MVRGLIQTRELNVLKIPITFTPRECTKYDESVIVDINGLHKIEVKIIGEGIPLKLELDKSEDQNIDFGVFSIGQAGTRSVFLMNQSQKTINISFDIDTQLKDIKQKNFIKVRPKREI
jgi:hydrocephalus-inducing protein